MSVEHAPTASPPPFEQGISLHEAIGLVVRHIRLLVLLPLAAAIVAFGLSYLIPPKFTSVVVVMPPQPQQSAAAAALQSLGAMAGMGTGAALKNPAEQYVALVGSATLSDRIIKQFGLMEVYGVSNKQDARALLGERVRVALGKRDGLLSIEVDDLSPERAANMANAYVEHLRRLANELSMTEAQQRRTFFERQMAQTNQRLASAQKALQGSGINEGTLRAEPRAAADSYASLKARVTEAEVRLVGLKAYMTDSAPEMKAAQANLTALSAQLGKIERQNSDASAGDYIDKYREYKYQETLLELLARQFEMAKLDESRDGALIQVLDPAEVPQYRSKPNRINIALATALAMGALLLLYIFGRHMWQKAASVPAA